jgi:DNA-binding NarL/FixJ family response regulator
MSTVAAASPMTMAGFISKDRSPSVKKQSQSSSLLDDVRQAMAAVRHGSKKWHEKVADEHQAELAAIKAAWLAGELGSRRKTLARDLSARMRERGISDVGEQGVIAWLDAV